MNRVVSTAASCAAAVLLSACAPQPDAHLPGSDLARSITGSSETWVSFHVPAGIHPHRMKDRWRHEVATARERGLACAGIGKAQVVDTFRAIPMAVVVVDAEGARRLSGCPGVRAVGAPLDFVAATDASVPLIRADLATSEFGLSGLGTSVVVIDSGVDYTKPEFGGCSGLGVGATCRVPYGFDFADDDPDPRPACGSLAAMHGTNVSAIAVGVAGVAPLADLLHFKVTPDARCNSPRWDPGAILEALDWIVDQGDGWNIAAVNMSFGVPGRDVRTPCDSASPADAAFEAVAATGAVLVAAAGNDGFPHGVTYPACHPDVLAVAATYDEAGLTDVRWSSAGCTDATTSVDQIACGSNGGWLVDVAAPGAVIHAYAGDLGQYGTSQAAPHVAGAAALLREADPSADPAELVAALTTSRDEVTDARGGPTYRYPRLDLPSALGALDPPVVRLCTVSAECDDHDGCNGVEWCDVTEGLCRGALPPGCDAGETCHPTQGCVAAGLVPQVDVVPGAVQLEVDCAWQGGWGFPPSSEVTLVFEDPTAGVEAREVVTTDGSGAFDWRFGLACTDPADLARTQAFLTRVDPTGVGFTSRPASYRAEYWDGVARSTGRVTYSLSSVGSCVAICSGACGDDGCGGSCGGCVGVDACDAGTCASTGPANRVRSGTVSGAETWTLADSPVHVTGDLTVTGTLTIEAGVAVQLVNTADILVTTGSLRVDGTPELPVLFTSDGEAAPASWGGLSVSGSAGPVRLHHLEIRHGGAPGTVSDALRVSGRNVPDIVGLRLVDNRRDAIVILPGTYGWDMHWRDHGVPYWIDDDVTVAAGATLTIDPGVVVKLGTEYADLRVLGRLVAAGAADAQVVFTAGADDTIGGDTDNNGFSVLSPGAWGGILFADATLLPSSVLHDVSIRYAGSGDAGDLAFPIEVDANVQPDLARVQLVHNRVDAVAPLVGTYTSDLRLDSTGVAYWLRDDVVVNPGVTLTVEPGVVVKFDHEYTDLRVLGRLLARGTAERNVVFTSSADDGRGGDSNADGSTVGAPGDWGGLLFERGTLLPPSELTHAVVAYAGSGDAGDLAHPIEVDGTIQPVIRDVDLVDNRVNAVRLQHGAYGADLHLDTVGLAYWVTDDLVVNPGVTMTIEPGVVVKLEHEYTDVRVLGRLIANGTPIEPVVFTSAADDRHAGDSDADGWGLAARGSWGGVLFEPGTLLPPSELTNAVVAYAGSGDAGDLAYPIEVDGRIQPILASVTLEENRVDAVGLQTGTYTSNVRLAPTGGWPYWLGADLVVNPGVTMVVDPGVLVKVAGESTDLLVYGTLTAVGTASDRIVFTSSFDDLEGGDTDHSGTLPAPGDWGGIGILGATSSSLDRVDLRYAGSGDAGDLDCALSVEGNVVVAESTFADDEDAVCVFAGVADLGLGAFGSTGGNQFVGHVPGSGSWAVYNGAPADVSARGNDWGVATVADLERVLWDAQDDPTAGRVLWWP